MLKNHVQTEEKAVIDLRKSKVTAGLTFVCPSLAKRLVNLLIEPISFDKLSKLGEKPTSKLEILRRST